MNKIILKYGILGGIAASIVMTSITVYMKLNPEKTVDMFIGMFTMILAYAFIVLGILKLRKENNDTITLGKAFLCGLGIVFITSTIYVLVWLIIYYNFFPNFMEHYCDLALKQTPPEELVAKKAEMEYAQVKDKVLSSLKEIMRPELLNRIDKILVFRPLGKEEIKKINLAWAQVDKKHQVTKNFANVQCLNCHGVSDNHPKEKLSPKVDIKNNCLACHTPDQSPEWYESGIKLNAKFDDAYKKVSCPKI